MPCLLCMPCLFNTNNEVMRNVRQCRRANLDSTQLNPRQSSAKSGETDVELWPKWWIETEEGL
jgi:hypothetical protein